VYGVNRELLDATLRSVQRLIARVTETVAELESAADAQYELACGPPPAGGGASVSAGATESGKQWAANYARVLSVRWSLSDALTATAGHVNDIRVQLQSKSLAERVDDVRKENDAFVALVRGHAAHLNALLAPSPTAAAAAAALAPTHKPSTQLVTVESKTAHTVAAPRAAAAPKPSYASVVGHATAAGHASATHGAAKAATKSPLKSAHS
jgi:hypothetical protein